MREASKTLWEALKRKYTAPAKARPRHIESDIQIACVNWFRSELSELSDLLFSVPNGGQRNAITAKMMKREGVVAGVSDLILFVPRKGYHALCIEMKTDKGKQSDKQKRWQKQVERQGYKYIICRSVDEFAREITEYLKAEI